MRLLYATSIDLPSTRANRLQVVSMARALRRALGGDFILGLREAGGRDLQDIPYVRMGSGRSVVLALQYVRLAKKGSYTYVYCREERLLFFMLVWSIALRIPLKFTYEAHHLGYVQGAPYRWMLRKVSNIVAITRAMRDELENMGISSEKMLVAPDAVDLSQFAITKTREEARRALDLPLNTHMVMYTGSIDEPWKGVGVLYEAAKNLHHSLVVIVGGKPHYVEAFRRAHPDLPNVVLRGHQPHERIPLYLQAADVLALPNSEQAEISRTSTSPMKLFEYMASGRPIVASDLPSIREVLDDTTAALVRPDDPDALARGISELLQNSARAKVLAEAARERVKNHTWDERARNILAFI